MLYCILILEVIYIYILFLDCSYGAVSNNHMRLRTGLSTEYEESSEQLIKVYIQYLTYNIHC